jgi:hypothetical protein
LIVGTGIEREREKERHTHMMMMWMQQQVFNYRDVVSFAVVSISYHTYRYLAGEMRKKKNDTLAGLPFTCGWLYSITGRLFDIPFAPLPKILRSGFFLYESFVGIPYLPIFFFVSFLRRKWRSDKQTNKQKKRSKRRK